MLVAALSVLAGLVACVAAIAVRRPLVARLGAGYTGRFLLVQGLAINGALYYVVQGMAGWSGIQATWWLPLAYGPLFFLYSLSNIDWTARKFHDLEA